MPNVLYLLIINVLHIYYFLCKQIYLQAFVLVTEKGVIAKLMSCGYKRNILDFFVEPSLVLCGILPRNDWRLADYMVVKIWYLEVLTIIYEHFDICF